MILLNAKEKANAAYPFRWPFGDPTWADRRRIEGYVDGYEQAVNDIKSAIIELREKYRNDPEGDFGNPDDKRAYLLGKCNAACDVIDFLEGKNNS